MPLVFFYHIGGAIAFVPPVGLGVDERTLDCKFLLVLLIRKLFSLVEHFCWTCGLYDGTLSKSRWTPSQASSPCLHGYLKKVGHYYLCLCPTT